jgi:hypothetical protein
MTSARRVFIAGGTGYLGRHLIPPLLQRGHGVIAVCSCAEAVGGEADLGLQGRIRRCPRWRKLPGAPDTELQVCTIGRRTASEPVEGPAVRGHRPNIRNGSHPCGAGCRHRPLRLCQRGASGARDESLYGPAGRMRGSDPGIGSGRRHSSPLVCAGSGTQLAPRSGAVGRLPRAPFSGP